MCGIGGQVRLDGQQVPNLPSNLAIIDRLIAHRGPDGHATWVHANRHVGFAHRRLAIIDLTTGDQPMTDQSGNWITYNGEIYNYRELRDELGEPRFRTTSDTEVILRAYERWGENCVSHLRGMFAFALWDEARSRLFAARDRFGMKPFYYAESAGVLTFASEAKALLPFLERIETDPAGLKDYLAFQSVLDGKTLFRGVRELPPGHTLTAERSQLNARRYWDVHFKIDFQRSAESFEGALRAALEDSVRVHLRADVPVGAYLSGGVDSTLIASLAARTASVPTVAFTGAVASGPEYDERRFAREAARDAGLELREIEIGAEDFIESIQKIIWHLDYPTSGPGAFAQYMVSRLAAAERKVVLGGQGGDELFGGYARYLIAYLEQCLKAAIDGTMNDGHFIVSYESILPNLTALHRYKPLLQDFWRDGMFESMEQRYYHLVNRAGTVREEIRWEALGDYSPFDTFLGIFNGDNLADGSYFDRMTHFDFKALLPGLLHVEDRMSMAHGIESRLPFLDHGLVELAATIPSNIKFEGGRMKRILKDTFADVIPLSIRERTDKMGFPIPFNEWARGPARELVLDVMLSDAARHREYIDNEAAVRWLSAESPFGRNFWGLFSLELWQQQFHDHASSFRETVAEPLEVSA